MTRFLTIESLGGHLQSALRSRLLGARLTDVLAHDCAVVSRWGRIVGTAGAERALLPLTQALPDLQIAVEDVIAGRNDGYVRMIITGTHLKDGVLGPATGQALCSRVMARVGVHNGLLTEGLVIVDSADWPGCSAGVQALPDRPVTAPSGDWGRAWHGILSEALEGDPAALPSHYAKAAQLDWPGTRPQYGAGCAEQLWAGLRAALPGATGIVLSAMGRDDALMRPRAAAHWRLQGRHDGWGPFGAPTGQSVTVDGISMAEFCEDGVHREWSVFDTRPVLAQLAETDG